MMKLLVVLAACADVQAGADDLGIADIGHYWKCDFEIRYYQFPPDYTTEDMSFRPCLAPGNEARDAYQNAWVTNDCNVKITAAIADGTAPGGGSCGGVCDPQNWDLCNLGNQ